MAFHGYHDLISSLGISSAIVAFSWSGSLIMCTLSPTNVMPVQAENTGPVNQYGDRWRGAASQMALNIVPTTTMMVTCRILVTASAWYLLFDSTKSGWLFDWFQMPRVLRKAGISLRPRGDPRNSPVEQLGPDGEVHKLRDAVCEEQHRYSVRRQVVHVAALPDQIPERAPERELRQRSFPSSLIRDENLLCARVTGAKNRGTGELRNGVLFARLEGCDFHGGGGFRRKGSAQTEYEGFIAAERRIHQNCRLMFSDFLCIRQRKNGENAL